MSKKLRCAVIGVGNFGRHYVRLISSSRHAVLSAVAVKSETSLKKIKKDLPVGVRATTNVSSILKDQSIDAVFIATPVGTHCKLIIEALKNSKHVFVEKPMCSSLIEALKIEKSVLASKHIFMLGHQYLYNDYINHVKKILDMETLGKARYISAEQLYFTPIRPDIGCFWETATHELAIIDYLFNADKLIKAQGQAIDFSGGKKDDFATANLRFMSGLVGTITTSWFSPIRSRKLIIGLDKGIIVFDDRVANDKLKIYSVPFPFDAKKKQIDSYRFNLDKCPCISPEYDIHEPLETEISAFFEAIKSNVQPLTDIKHGLRVTRMLDTIYKSFEIRKTNSVK